MCCFNYRVSAKNRLLAGVLALVLLCLAIRAAGAEDEIASGYEEVASEARDAMAEYYQADGPGCAVAVCVDGKVVFLGTYGLANLREKRPVTPDSVFDLASVSKHFTALSVLLLQQDGLLSLEDAYADHVPDFSVRPKGRPVTIADLLHHVSGLPDYTGEEWDEDNGDFATYTNDDHLAWMNQQTALRKPGVTFDYNNSGYVLLSTLVQKVSGETLSKFLGQRVFRSAGMSHTRVCDGAGGPIRNTVSGYATDEDDGGVKPSSSPSIITGDGNIFSSARDLGAWICALQRVRPPVSKEILRQAWAPGLLDNGKPVRYEEGEDSSYGGGWVLDDAARQVSHSGSWAGTATYIALDRPSGVGVVVLSNDENSDVESLATDLAGLEWR